MNYMKILMLVALVAFLVAAIFGYLSKSEYGSLQTGYESLEAEYNTLLEKEEALTEENSTLKVNMDKKSAELTVVQASYDELRGRYEDLLADHALLQTTNADLESDLAEIQKVYPPRYFQSGEELREWLARNKISGVNTADPVLVYKSALELQKRALRDGFIVNTEITMIGTAPAYYTIWCSAVTEENSLYFWNPDSDAPNYFLVNINNFSWAVGFP